MSFLKYATPFQRDECYNLTLNFKHLNVGEIGQIRKNNMVQGVVDELIVKCNKKWFYTLKLRG